MKIESGDKETIIEEEIMKVISGNFTENSKVTVEIYGKYITRKVRYNCDCGLYIVYQTRKYFEYEFEFY